MDKKVVAERIKELRKELNLTQTELAHKLGTTQAAVSAWELGDRLPGTEFLYKMATEFNVSIDGLLGLSNRMYLFNRITRYPDLMRLLIMLCTVYDDQDNKLIEIQFPEGSEDKTILHMTDVTCRHYLEEWKKIYDLFKVNTIDVDLYELWLKKTYHELDGKLIDFHDPWWG